MTISNEAVEAAARVMLDKMYDDKTLKVDDEDRDIMRAALEAAAPFIRAEALLEAADAIRAERPEMGPGINITQYRDGRNDAFTTAAALCASRAAEMRQG